MASVVQAWVRSLWEPKHVTLSKDLVKKLNLPPSTSQFIVALQPSDAPNSVVYVLSTLYRSEKAASDARDLIAVAQPKAVVSLVDVGVIELLQEEEKVASRGGGEDAFPTSIVEVLQEVLIENPDVVSYDSRARILAEKCIFGAGLFSDVIEAKQAATKVSAEFRYLGFPLRTLLAVKGHDAEEEQEKSSGNNSPNSPKLENEGEEHAGTRRATSGLTSLGADTPLEEIRKWRQSSSVALAQAFGHNGNELRSSSTQRSDAPDHPSEAAPHESEELNHVPEFAKLMEPLFKDLLQVYQTPALYHALQCANKMFLDVENGRAVDPNDVMEACRFRFALEMARVKLNMQIPETTNKVLKRTAADFHNLSYEDKCNALLAQSLQKQAKRSGTVVAVVDVGRVPGIRQQWNQPLPEEFSSLIDECFILEDEEQESMFSQIFPSLGEKANHVEGSQEKKAVVIVGAGAAAAVGLAYLPNWVTPLSPLMKLAAVKLSTLLKLGFLNTKRTLALSFAKGLPAVSKVALPSIKASAAKSASASAAKAALSAEKTRQVSQGVVAGLQKQTLQAIRTTFYSLMRRSQGKQVGRSPWLLFGGSVIAGGGVLFYGDTVERAIGAVPVAGNVARLGRGLASLSRASKQVDGVWDKLYADLYAMKGNLS